MKKQFLILATITAFVFISCTKEKIEAPQTDVNEEIATARSGGSDAAPSVSNRGLLGRFEFSGNLQDATGQLADGVSPGNRILYTTDRKGQANKALHFNAAYGVDILDVPLQPEGSSISVWVKYDTLPVYWLSPVFSFKGFIIQQSAVNFDCSFFNGIMNVQQNVFSGPLDNNWHHMAATRDNTSLKFYINGVLIGTSPTPKGAGPYPAIQNYLLGHAYGNYWKGSIDDLRFYSRVLSPKEIQALFNQ